MALDEITWLTQNRILQKFGITQREARQSMVRYTLRIADAELDINIVRESNRNGVFGSEEFIKNMIDLKTVSSMTRIQFSDVIIAAEEEFSYNLNEISSGSREKRLVDIRSILALTIQNLPGIYLQQLAHYLNRDSSSLCRLVKRAKLSQDLETKSKRLLEITLSKVQERS